MNLVKREQSAAIDIPSPNGKDVTHASSRNRSSTHDSKSTDSTPNGAQKDTPPKSDKEATPPERTHSPVPPPASGLSVLERSYSEPIPVQDPCGGELRGRGQEGIGCNDSRQELMMSSLPNSAVAIQIEVSGSGLKYM